jgi:Contractile injection system tube protein
MTEALGRAITGLGPAAAPILGVVVRAKFIPDPTKNPGPPVLFSFSPKELTAERISQKVQLPTSPPTTPPTGSGRTGGSPTQWQYTTPMKLSFTAFLEGELTKPMGDLLMSWMNPVNSIVTALAGQQPKPELPKLLFQWGPPLLGFVFYCTMESCKITYKRFSMLGVPTRADAVIKIAEEPSVLGVLQQNPTSGGQPGRHQHTMLQGENVVTVANARYRNPRAWRDIAAVNGVDDPLRSPPGSRIYLPAPGELRGGTGT